MLKNPSTITAALALALALAAAALVSGCAGVSHIMGAGPERAVVAKPIPVTPAERVFMTKAAAKTMYELEVSRLAADRAIDPRVRTYAQSMVVRQTQFTNELVALMSARGVAPPKGLSPEKATKLHKLASLKPSPAFDQGYVRVVGIEDHEANIAMLEQGRRVATDAELKAWIDRTLPALRRQLSVAQNLAGSLTG
jgi:putative membrane protein